MELSHKTADLIRLLGLIASIILPLWNVPMIVRIGRRKSSKDISLAWALGVWICFLFILPSALLSSDVVFKVFSLVNIVFFTVVVVQVVRYR